ncbi:hypothetical protein EIN_372710 [Entamoeba invadens IP1]|uniref:Phospholipase B-like n=1 Tax=Entamoeba invadens IP1 TaxID=370355 RepID=A0A0A1TXZ7_ENTIV|nr:hypothetical protein EIN_372710 [Entamoeba invadens IP1]ELP83376.1 hypothetical protein EIN_372710 [Entamoeba invadens IP1]|eukprot:XP_004182722.1 hypothetical protein EIN_372710 [Entamoeba invadens IP1]
MVLIVLLHVLNLINMSRAKDLYSAVKRNQWMIEKGKTVDAVAFGYYEDTHMTKGWGFLTVETNKKSPSEQQAFAAGFLEGFLTKHLLQNFWDNYRLNEYGKLGPPRQLTNFMAKQYLWWAEQCKTNKTEYWKNQNLIFRQFRGLVSGYNKYNNKDKKLSVLEIYFINAMGDLSTLNKLVPHDSLPKYSMINLEKLNAHEIFHECTGFIRILPHNKDIVLAHNTWRPYYAMSRIYKTYVLAYTRNARPITFPSSPGFLHSKDDFYTLKSKRTHFGVIETTNSVFNTSIFKGNITFTSLFTWQRIMSAIYFAKTAQRVLHAFSQYNSGTYNNQWMVLDYTKFTDTGKLPQKDLLLIAEQIPGRVEIQDVTSVLIKQGYWASYNSPYSKTIRDISGYTEREKDYGERYSYTKSPRRRIFDRDAKHINTLDQIKKFMLLNKFKTDPLTEGKPGATIAARYDLDENRPSPFGAVDCKINSKTMGLDAWIYGAPSHEDNQPFVWSDSVFTDVVHKGLPDKYDFGWILAKQ